MLFPLSIKCKFSDFYKTENDKGESGPLISAQQKILASEVRFQNSVDLVQNPWVVVSLSKRHVYVTNTTLVPDLIFIPNAFFQFCQWMSVCLFFFDSIERKGIFE